MKKTKKTLLAAVSMLVVSATVLSTASYAWFTMQKTASVNGLDMVATAPSSLEISTTSKTTGFGNTASFTTTTKSFAPVSGTTAIGSVPAFYNTLTNTQDGILTSGNFANSNATFGTIGAPFTGEIQHYVDIPVYFRSTSLAATKSLEIFVKSLVIDSKTADATNTLGNAFKMAVLKEDKTAYAGAVTSPFANASTPWSPIDYNESIYSVSSTQITPQAFYTTNSTNKIVTLTTKAIAGAEGGVIGVTLRVWLEGQDADCKNANSGKTVKVALSFEALEV